MKKILFTAVLAASAVAGFSQKPWKMKLYAQQEKINLNIDLYEESITVPTLEDFGPMNGYMNGNIYGVWMVTSFEIKNDKECKINLSNDLGSETQKASLTQTGDSIYTLNFEGYNAVKKVDGKKLAKIPSTIQFKIR